MKYTPTQNALAARERFKNNSIDLIKYISDNRKLQLEQYFNNNPKLYELEKKYGKYLMVPLALPVFEVPDREHFMHWWKQYAIRPTKQQGDLVASNTGNSPFESIDLVQKVGNDWNLNLQTENFKKEFPYLWQQFYDQLPCDDILTLNLWSAVETFSEHRDSAEMFDCPNSFRINLYDENPENSLYVFDNPTKPYQIEEPTFLPNLPTTNTYMWNNLRCMHGSVYDPKYKKVLAAVIGLINPNKYDEVMTRSIATYKEHCLISNNELENYVDL